MPPRLITALIVCFWLATSGWYFYREFWPYLLPGEAPPYTIDLVDETHQLPNHWDVSQADKKVGRATTKIKYHKEDDSFELDNDLDVKFETNGPGGKIQTGITMVTTYRISREGNLRAVSADVTLTVRLGNEPVIPPVQGTIDGTVQDGQLLATGELVLQGQKQPLLFDPVEMSGRGAVLNPLHPVKRIAGLQPGRSWTVRLFDPLSVLSGARLKGAPNANFLLQLALQQARGGDEGNQFRTLTATVQPEPQLLAWGDGEVPCLVIEYRGGQDMTTRIWVRQSDGVVLQQEASSKGDRLLLKRFTTFK
jgi:hypothetical protein